MGQRRMSDNDEGNLHVVQCLKEEDVTIIECEGGCGEMIVRPLELPKEADALCKECFRELMADAAEHGVEVHPEEIVMEGVS